MMGDLDLFNDKVKFGNLGFSMGKMKTADFSETIAASDLKGRRSRHLIEFTKVCEGQGHFFTIYLKVLYVLCFTGPRYQVSIYWTIGLLVSSFHVLEKKEVAKK